MKIPYRAWSEQFSEETLRVVGDVMKSGICYGGRETELFEKELAEFCETKYAVATNSGTSALLLGLLAANIGRDDEVIMAANVYSGVINATFAAGARPVLAEIDERTSNIDASKVEDLITERTKSIVVQHMYALPADLDPLRRLAEGYDLVLIEDCAQSLGARYKGARIGSIGVFGFASVGQKIITVYGPGGILFTHSKDLARRVSCLRDQGHVREENISFIRSRADDWYGMSVPGFQFHMPEAMSAIGRMQVPMIDKWNSQRRKNAALYTAILGDASLPVQLPVEPEWATPAYLHYVIKVDGRDKLRDHLSAAGIETKRIYPIPIHFQPPVKKVTGYKAGDFPVAERDAARVLALPVGIHMTEEMITYVAEEVIRFYK